MKDDLSILIQGPINEISLSAIDEYCKFANNIIISTWNLTPDVLETLQNRFNHIKNLKISSHTQPDYIKLINENKLFGVTIGTTWYWQILGVKNGVEECDTKYIIRTRSDEYFKNLQPLIDKFLDNEKKFTCGNIWFKPKSFMPLHIGDHLYISKTKILKKSVDFIIDVMHNKYPNNSEFKKIVYQMGSKHGGHNHPESILAKSIVFHSKKISYDSFKYDAIDWSDTQLCKDFFDIIDINELSPIRWAWSRGRSNGEIFDETASPDPSMRFIKTMDEY